MLRLQNVTCLNNNFEVLEAYVQTEQDCWDSWWEGGTKFEALFAWRVLDIPAKGNSLKIWLMRQKTKNRDDELSNYQKEKLILIGADFTASKGRGIYRNFQDLGWTSKSSKITSLCIWSLQLGRSNSLWAKQHWIIKIWPKQLTVAIW